MKMVMAILTMLTLVRIPTETVGWTNWLALMLTKTESATSMTPIHNLQPLQPVIGMVMAFLTTHSINP